MGNRESNRRWNEANRDKMRRYRRDHYARNKAAYREKLYGLTPEGFDLLFEDQSGACAICRTLFEDQTPHVDHDHATGKVRGLLCGECNLGLGKFKDDPERLQRALDYIRKVYG